MTHLSEAILYDTKGIVLTLSDPAIATYLHEHAEFFVIDAAARRFSPEIIQALVLAAKDKPVLVRAENTFASTLQGYLNAGADGLILTNIHHAAEAEKAIHACLYPPEGVRPLRPIFAHEQLSLEAVNDQITLIVEVAHPQTIASIEEIAEVTGINGLLLAPQRLAVAMEKGSDPSHVNVQQALQSVVLAARNYDLPWGMEGEAAKDFMPNFKLPVSDAQLLRDGLAAHPVFASQEENEEVFLTAIR